MMELEKNPFVVAEPLDDSINIYNTLDGSSFNLKLDSITDFDTMLECLNTEKLKQLIQCGIFVYKNKVLNSLCLHIKAKLPLFGVSKGCFSDLSEASVGILGVPYGNGNSKGQGTADAPAALRLAGKKYSLDYNQLASSNMLGRRALNWPVPHNSKSDKSSITDLGNIVVYSFETQHTIFNRIESIVKLLHEQNVIPFIIGGDHSITLPILRGYKARNKPINLIQFDAHTDNYVNRFESALPIEQISHANFINQVIKEELVEEITQIGIRGLSNISAHTQGLNIVSAYELDVNFHIERDSEVYISIDVDVLDPLIMMATGHPVPHGLNLLQLYQNLDFFFSNYRVIGVDLVEFDPAKSRGNYDTEVCLELALYLIDRLNIHSGVKHA